MKRIKVFFETGNGEQRPGWIEPDNKKVRPLKGQGELFPPEKGAEQLGLFEVEAGEAGG